MSTASVDNVTTDGEDPLVARDVAARMLDASNRLQGDPKALHLMIQLWALLTGARGVVALTARVADLETLEWHGLIREDAARAQSVVIRL